ncbi:MAG: hypothetical protein WBV92_09015 [Nitrosotalea sp.]
MEKNYNDVKFATCKDNHHNIIPMLDKKEINGISKQTKTNAVNKVKGRIGEYYVESIIIDGKPKFLCVSNGNISQKDSIEHDGIIHRPLEAKACGYVPYNFSSFEFIELTSKEQNKEELLDQIKSKIDRYISLREIDKNLILGDVFLTYCLEWINTIHYPFFVGETESGKSTALHLAKLLCYRCHLGEDIPSADVYNFLGTDEEGTGTIAEDEAQELSRNFEKIRMYKSGYSMGSLKARIIGVDNLGKLQVYYKTFCPKWFAGERTPQDKGFSERLAIIHMTEGQPVSNIKRISEQEKQELAKLRNAMLMWKVQNISKGLTNIESGLTQRDQELWEDFLSIAHDTKYFDKFKNVVRYYVEQRHNAIKNSLEAKLFKFVIVKLDSNLEVGFEDYWNYLTVNNTEFAGKLDERSNKTFYAEEYSEKITQYIISKIFDNKFQAVKHVKVIRDQNKIQHQTTVYKFDRMTIITLSRKYGVEIPLDNPLYVGQQGKLGSQSVDHDDLVNQVSEERSSDNANKRDMGMDNKK